MSCNYPITAWQCPVVSNGRVIGTEIVFDERKGDAVHQLHLPCGQCDGCRLERTRQWAVRCMHEASLYEENCFITLTYNDKHLPVYENLVYDDFQRFMKRLRKKFCERKIRFFACGEYGETRRRPHFHACIFNLDFADKLYFKKSAAGSKLYTSKTLDLLWSDRSGANLGFATIGALTFESAGYCARYVMKKRLGRFSDKDYQEIDMETGEVFQREKEFCRMSLKPGIGYDFYKKWTADIFPQDICVINGKETKPPKYYYKKLAQENEFNYNLVQESRWEKAQRSKADNTPERLEVKEKVLKARANLFLKRNSI